MIEVEKYLDGVMDRYFKYSIVAFIIIILCLSTVAVAFVGSEDMPSQASTSELASEDDGEANETISSTDDSLSESLTEYGDPPTNHRIPAQHEEAEKILTRWNNETQDLQNYHTDLAVNISKEATVEIIAKDQDEASYINDTLESAGADMENVSTVVMNHDYVHWIRDYGPVSMINKTTGNVSFINMKYTRTETKGRYEENKFPREYGNKTGVDYHDMKNESGDWFTLDGGHKFIEGSGIFYTTNDAYDRNSHLGNESEVEKWATKWFNLVENEKGFEAVEKLSDSGHLDMQVNILNETTVVVSEIVSGTYDQNDAEVLDRTADFFKNATARNGESFNVTRLPMHVEMNAGGSYTYYTHSNSLIVNGVVLVPTYGQGTDTDALEAYENATDKKVIGIYANYERVARAGGAIHCTTREIPKENIPPSINITGIEAMENKNVT
ncbi:MAG: agmatine deiminase family protein, partial [Candidatus Thermoplasmatota archaeon]